MPQATVPQAPTITVQALREKSSEQQNAPELSQEPQLQESPKPSSYGDSGGARHIVLAGTSTDLLGLDGGTMRRRMQG